MKGIKRLLFCGYVMSFLTFFLLLPSQGMALEPGLYIPDLDQGIVFKMNLEDRSVSAFYPKTGQIPGPYYLAQDEEGNLIVSVYYAGQIIRVSAEGKFIETIASGLSANIGMAFDSSGNLYVAESEASRITRISLSGEKDIIAVGLGGTGGLVFDSDENLYISSPGIPYPPDPGTGKVFRISNDQLKAFVPGYPVTAEPILEGLDYPTGIEYREGKLYICEWTNHEILALDLSTYMVSVYFSGIPRPVGLDSSEEGDLYVGQNNVVGLIDSELNYTVLATGFGRVGGVLYVPPRSLPPPTIIRLSPESVMAGGLGFTLTVYGVDFVPGAVVLWNNSNRETTFISDAELRAAITAADIAVPGTVNITVSNPPPGGGLSNSLPLSIVSPVPSVTSLSPSSALTGGADFTLTVTGTNFMRGSVLRWNGFNRPTTFVSNTQIQGSISADDIADPGIINVAVFNPSPGGGSLNALPFRIKIATRVELSVDSVFVSYGTKYVKLKARVIDTLTGQPIYGIGYRYIYTYFYLDRRYIGMSRVNGVQGGAYAGYSVMTYKIKSGPHPAKAIFNENDKYGGSEAQIQFNVP